MTFSACIPVILKSEGGFSNTPHDSGGATNFGITQRTLSAWLGHPASLADVQNLTQATAEQIYQTNYYNAAHCDALAPGLDLMVFDEAVNQGVGQAVRSLQQALGVTVDGVFGPVTTAAATACNVAATINQLFEIRAALYRGMANFGVFGAGWMNRIEQTRTVALTMATSAKV
jgi:lysozyme family protein